VSKNLKEVYKFQCQISGCKKDATWITKDNFDIRCCCDGHKEELEKEIEKESSPTSSTEGQND